MMEVAYRFAGFDDEPCGCAAVLPCVAGGVQRLHLLPRRVAAATTMTVLAVDLRRGDSDLVPWVAAEAVTG
jgi:methoxymalonate biosynthesis protein